MGYLVPTLYKPHYNQVTQLNYNFKLAMHNIDEIVNTIQVWAIRWLRLVVLLLLAFCLLLLPLWESVIVLCFVVRYFMSILVLQSS